jgi:hypothetical protein
MGSAHIKELEERLEELCANTPEITFWEELL